MKFQQIEGAFYFIDEKGTYRVQDEDIQRLKLRPGTRVLRFLDENDEMVALPLTIAVGEVEGFNVMVNSIS